MVLRAPASIASVLATIPAVLASVQAVFEPVATVLASVPHVFAAISDVLTPIAHVLATIAHIFTSVADILTAVSHVLPSIPHAPVVASIPPVLPSIPDVLPPIAHVFATISDVLTPIPNVLSAISDILAPVAQILASIPPIGAPVDALGFGRSSLAAALGLAAQRDGARQHHRDRHHSDHLPGHGSPTSDQGIVVPSSDGRRIGYRARHEADVGTGERVNRVGSRATPARGERRREDLPEEAIDASEIDLGR